MTQRTLEDTGSNPWAGGKKRTTKTSQLLQPTSPPICKTGIWTCTGGAKHTNCVSLYHALMVVVGLQGAHTGSGRHGWYLLRVPCPGSRSAHSTGTSYLLSAQVPWLVQERVTCNRQREALLALCVCVCVCACVRVCVCTPLQFNTVES